MVTDTKEVQELEIIYSQNWELPAMNLGEGKYEWRPGMAHLPYFLFEGPIIGRRSHGLALEKDLIISAHGPRGATKTCTLSFLLAKKMRMGQKVWCNWPIAFYVVEKDCYDKCNLPNWRCAKCRSGAKTYYENYPLDFNKLYAFNSEISNGAVGITEMQYYAESRTSGRVQNRFIGYQLMQIRKSALSFNYDVQNENWVDNRFRWSDDVEMHNQDASKLNYEGEDIEEGAIALWNIRDMSGILTGAKFSDTGIEYGPYQFDAKYFWWIYPTKWKVDVYEAVYSMKQESKKADPVAKYGEAVTLAINYFLEQEEYYPSRVSFTSKASELSGLNIVTRQISPILASYDIESAYIKQTWVYDLTPIRELNEKDKKK